MENNITSKDLDTVIKFLKNKKNILTQSKNVKLFEKRWSEWLGVKYSIFVNSGSSANLLSMTMLKQIFKNGGEVIVPSLTWVSDVSSVIQSGFKPVFVDISLKNLSMNEDEIKRKISKKTIAVFITHAQGFNGLSNSLIRYLKSKSIFLIEDVCEAHGASFKNKKLGTYGLISNFSFYYAHHMSTIEGGMVCTNNYDIYQQIKILRSHGMLRETSDINLKKKYYKKYKFLNKDFIFINSAYNFRSTEINAVIGLSQLKNLNKNIKKRNDNHKFFLNNLDQNKYFTDFDLVGSSNYAFNVVLRKKNKKLMINLTKKLERSKVEFRQGSAGGGNQLRQPYLRNIVSNKEYLNYPNTEHIHFFGLYIGNFPNLSKGKILKICNLLNSVN